MWTSIFFFSDFSFCPFSPLPCSSFLLLLIAISFLTYHFFLSSSFHFSLPCHTLPLFLFSLSFFSSLHPLSCCLLSPPPESRAQGQGQCLWMCPFRQSGRMQWPSTKNKNKNKKTTGPTFFKAKQQLQTSKIIAWELPDNFSRLLNSRLLFCWSLSY